MHRVYYAEHASGVFGGSRAGRVFQSFLPCQPPPPSVMSMKKIMIVDNEPDILFLTAKLLRKEGYETIEALSSEECFRKLDEEKADLILLDILGIDWCKILEKLKKDDRFKSIPVVMFTVVAEEHAVSNLKCVGYDRYLAKPFERDKILEIIKELLKKDCSPCSQKAM